MSNRFQDIGFAQQQEIAERDSRDPVGDAMARMEDADFLLHTYSDELLAEQLDDEYADPLREGASNCGMLPDGTCKLAGTVQCDWECPFGASG